MPARRSKGDGGLTQRHDHESCPPVVDGVRPEHKCRGRWQGSVPVSPGSKQRKYVYGTTKREAQDKLRDVVNAKASGNLVVGHLTVEGWLTHWLEHIAEVKPQTYRSYESKVRVWLIPHLGKHRLNALQPDHIRLLYRTMRDQGSAEANVRQTHAILARALKIAMQEGKLARNPIESVKPPSTKTNKVKQLTMAQARQVLATTDDARWWLAVFYGMRQGEVLGLRWCDIDFEKGLLYVVQTRQKGRDGTVIFGTPKSDAGERVVPLIPMMAARLKLAWVAAGSPTPESGELVFSHVRRDGTTGPRDTKRDWTEWRELLDAATRPPMAPLPQVRLHSARGTAASLLEAAGVPPRVVGQIIGHANVKQTEHYQHAEVERMAAALTAGASLLDLVDLPDVAELSDPEIVDVDE